MRFAEACLGRPVIVSEVARSAPSQPTWPPSYTVWLGVGTLARHLSQLLHNSTTEMSVCHLMKKAHMQAFMQRLATDICNGMRQL